MQGARIFIMAAVLIFTGLTVSAQQSAVPGRAGRGAPNNGAPEQKREEVQKKVEAIKMWRLTEFLKLDGKTSAKLASVLSSVEQQRRGLMRERMAALKALRLSLKSDHPDESTLRTALDKLEKNQSALTQLRNKEQQGVKVILTTEQQARYVVFQHDFRREMQDMIAGARGPRQGMQGGGR